MAKYFVEEDSLTSVADAIRAKGGTSEPLSFPDGFVNAVEGIQAGGSGSDDSFTKLIEAIIVDLSNDQATKVGAMLLKKCGTLKSVNLPNVITLGADCFSGCSNLYAVNLPKLQTINGSCFLGTAVSALSFPKLVTVTGGSSFNGCSKLSFIDLGVNFASFYGNSVFAGCSLLSTVVLRNTTKIATLGNVSSFNNTPFASGRTGGTVYVPSALIESYQTATNWSTLYAAGTCNFVAIEGSEYE